jgi:thiol-disulfide isomerase/thioredoxin
MFEALASTEGRLSDAQRKILVSDGTPDVPHASSNSFLAQRLEAAARREGKESNELIDELLAEALREPLAWERETRLLDGVGRAFGIASLRSLKELEAQVSSLSELHERLETYADRWGRALEALRRENLDSFRAAFPAWQKRLEPAALAALDAGRRRSERDRLLGALVEFTRSDDQERLSRLRDLHRRHEESQAARYRAEVRMAALLRMRTLLEDVAGGHYMSRYAPPEERDALTQLTACEDLALVAPHETPRASQPPEPFPSLSAERRGLEAITPGWLGLRYHPPPAAERRRHALAAGAVVASRVFPGSPAAKAGLQVGDLILGPPGESFRERHALREWVMRGEIGRPRALRLLRDGKELEITVVLDRYPLELPARAPQIGSVAPDLELDYLPGTRPPETGQAHLLFFWATRCGPCRTALPELLAFAKRRNLPVIAITDEYPEEIANFFVKHPLRSLEFVASDRHRVHFQKYGVSGKPTFVLVDAEGTVRHYQTGYDLKRGLLVEGWRWKGTEALDTRRSRPRMN